MDKKLIVPTIVVRPLLPPPPQIGARYQPQHLHWQIGRYKERLVSGPGGLSRGRIWVPELEGEQHNLVLDQAYDLIATHGVTYLANWAVVGTGSTPPAATQTGLTSEVARTQANDTGANGVVVVQRISNGVYEFTMTREFTEAQVGNRNLTEWGFSPVGTSGNNLAVRELFRDGSGNPIVITPASDQRLRLIYKTRITLSPVVATAASINITGLGVRNGLAVLTLSSGGAGGDNPDLVVVELAMTGNVINSGGGPISVYRNVYLHPIAFSASYTDTALNINVLAYKWPGVATYVNGSRQRKVNSTLFANTEANGTIRTIGLGPYHGGGFRFVLNSGQEITKTSLYKLTIGEWTVTWGP